MQGKPATERHGYSRIKLESRSFHALEPTTTGFSDIVEEKPLEFWFWPEVKQQTNLNVCGSQVID